VQAKTFFVAEMMCKQLIFCVKAATRLATGATQPYVYVDQLSLIFDLIVQPLAFPLCQN
jgi:hypothetical protein